MRNNIKEKLDAFVTEYLENGGMDAFRDYMVKKATEEYNLAISPNRHTAIVHSLGVTSAIDEICTIYGVGMDELKAENKGGKVTRARHHLCYRLVRNLNVGQATVARILKCHPSTVSKAVSRHADRMEDKRYAANG